MTRKCWIDNSECFVENGGDLSTEHCRLCQEMRIQQALVKKWDGHLLQVTQEPKLKAIP